MSSNKRYIERLAEVIEKRKEELPRGSYTTLLFQKGSAAIVAKVREEMEELIEAVEKDALKPAEGESETQASKAMREAIIHESADLLYHLLVLFAESDISLAAVDRELGRRFGTSGLEEKASRRRS
jgi:phosphoribosyl-ATP pyrophosphohydrolase